MKLNKKRKNQDPPKNLKETIDDYADQYKEASHDEAAATRRKKEINLVIKNIAKKNGVRKGKSTLIEGNKYAAGYTDVTHHRLDGNIAEAVLDEETFKAIQMRPPVIDPVLFERAVDEGRITAKQAASIIKVEHQTPRIVVKPLRKTATP